MNEAKVQEIETPRNDATDAGNSADEAGNSADEAGNSSDESGNPADEADATLLMPDNRVVDLTQKRAVLQKTNIFGQPSTLAAFLGYLIAFVVFLSKEMNPFLFWVLVPGIVTAFALRISLILDNEKRCFEMVYSFFGCELKRTLFGFDEILCVSVKCHLKPKIDVWAHWPLFVLKDGRQYYDLIGFSSYFSGCKQMDLLEVDLLAQEIARFIGVEHVPGKEGCTIRAKGYRKDGSLNYQYVKAPKLPGTHDIEMLKSFPYALLGFGLFSFFNLVLKGFGLFP